MFRPSSIALSTIGFIIFLSFAVTLFPGSQSASLANSATESTPSEGSASAGSPSETATEEGSNTNEASVTQPSPLPIPNTDAATLESTDTLTLAASSPMTSGPSCNQGTCLFIQVRTAQRSGPEMILGFNWQLSSPEMAKVEVLQFQQENARRKADQDYLLAKQNADRLYGLALMKELGTAISAGDVFKANLYAAQLAPLMGYPDGHALLNAIWVNPSLPEFGTIPALWVDTNSPQRNSR